RSPSAPSPAPSPPCAVTSPTATAPRWPAPWSATTCGSTSSRSTSTSRTPRPPRSPAWRPPHRTSPRCSAGASRRPRRPLPATPASPTCSRAYGQLHVSTADRNLRIRRPGVVLHRVADFQWTNVLGHQLMTAPSLFLQFAASLDLLSLVMVGDAMIGSWHGPRLCTLPQLTDHFSSRKSVKNRRGVEDALALIRPDVDSPRETELRLWIMSVGLPEPEIHPQIFCQQLNTTIRPDLGYAAARLAIEYESDFHRTDRRQWNMDIDRENALEHEGW